MARPLLLSLLLTHAACSLPPSPSPLGRLVSDISLSPTALGQCAISPRTGKGERGEGGERGERGERERAERRPRVGERGVAESGEREKREGYGAVSPPVSLHWRRFGRRGAPARVLLIMGMAATHNGWQSQVEALAASGQYELCVFDNRGTGASSAPPGPYSTEMMARDALALLDAMEWDNCHVVGFSMGGMIAMKLAAHAADRVRSLCLISTHLGGFTRRIPAVRGLAAIAQIVAAPLVSRLPAGGARLAARLRAHLDLHCHYTRRFLDSCALPPAPCGLPGVSERLRARVIRPLRRAMRRASRGVRALGLRLGKPAAHRRTAAGLRRAHAGSATGRHVLGVPLPRLVFRRAAPDPPAHSEVRARAHGAASAVAVASVAASAALSAKALRTPTSNYEALIEHYVGSRERGAVAPGLAGQVVAVMRHRMSAREVRTLRMHPVPKTVMHGREDIVVRPVNAHVLSRLIGAELHMLDSNHMAVVESADQVNRVLLRHLHTAQKMWEEKHSIVPWRDWPRSWVRAVANLVRAASASLSWLERARGSFLPALSPVEVRAS